MCAAISEVVIWAFAVVFGLIGFASAGKAIIGLLSIVFMSGGR